MARAAIAANFSTVRRSPRASGPISCGSQPVMGRDFRTLSMTILSGQGSSRFAIPSPKTATRPSDRDLACGLSNSLTRRELVLGAIKTVRLWARLVLGGGHGGPATKDAGQKLAGYVEAGFRSDENRE